MTELLTASTSDGFIRNYTETSTGMVDTEPLRIFGLVIGIFAIIVGSIGNFLTIAAIKTNKKLHKPFYIFIGSLSIIDFLTATLMLPFNVAAYYQRAWPFGNNDITCTLQAGWYYNCGYTSIVCLVVITVNRYVGVVWPENYDKLFTKSRVLLTIVISWLFAPTFLIPSFFFGGAHGFGWAPQITLCVFLTNDYTANQLNYMQFTRALFQIFPVIVMIVMYSLIFRTSKRSHRKVTSFSKVKTKESSKIQSLKKHMFLASPAMARLFWRSTLAKSYSTAKFESASQRETGEARYSKISNDTNKEICSEKGNISHTEKQVAHCNLAFEQTNFPSSVADELKFNSIFEPPQTEQQSELNTVSGSLKLSEKNSTCTYNSSKHQKLGQKLSTASTSSSSGKSKGKNRALSRLHAKRKKVDLRLLRVSVAICFFFMVLFLPSVIINFTSYRDWRIYPRINMGASVITWLNSCVNPLVYCFINATMRKQYKLLLKKFSSAIQCTKKTY